MYFAKVFNYEFISKILHLVRYNLYLLQTFIQLCLLSQIFFDLSSKLVDYIVSSSEIKHNNMKSSLLRLYPIWRHEWYVIFLNYILEMTSVFFDYSIYRKDYILLVFIQNEVCRIHIPVSPSQP